MSDYRHQREVDIDIQTQTDNAFRGAIRELRQLLGEQNTQIDDLTVRLVKVEEALAWFQRNAVRMPLPKDYRTAPDFDPDSESEAERVGVQAY